MCGRECAGSNGKGGNSGQITITVKDEATFFESRRSKELAFVARPGAGGMQTAVAAGGAGGSTSPGCGAVCYYYLYGGRVRHGTFL
jgi:hypothetical protein